MNIRYLYIVLLVFTFTNSTFSQSTNKTDSLIKLLNDKSLIDSIKIDIYTELSGIYLFKEPKQSIDYLNKARLIVNKESNFKTYVYIIKELAKAYFYLSNYEKSISYIKDIEKELITKKKLIETKNYKKLLAEINNIYGINYFKLSEYDNAIKYYIKALRLFEELDEHSFEAKVLNNLAIISRITKKYNEALNYYDKALDIQLKYGTPDLVAGLYNNIAIVYKYQNKIEKSLENYEKSLNINKELENISGIARTYLNIGDLYNFESKYDSARYYYMESLKLKISLSDVSGEANIYQSIADVYIKQNKYDDAHRLLNKSIALAEEIGELRIVSESYRNMAQIDSAKGNYVEAFNNLKKYYKVKNKITNTEINEKIALIKTQYQVEKSEEEILSLQKEKELKQSVIDRQKYIIYLLILVFVLIIGFVLFMSRMIRKLKIANKVLNDQKEEIIRQNEVISDSKNKLSKQLDITSYQKNQIERQKENITKSIKYARRIQTAALPPFDLINSVFKENFIFYLPKDIVSGDFYWVTKLKNHSIVVAADCTGHGVPGAFMSILGITYLTEIVTKIYEKIDSNEIRANMILEQMRKNVKRVLHQTSKISISQDGMDMALCIIDNQNKKIHFSGAYNPLYILRKSLPNSNRPELEVHEIKGDKMPVGISPGKRRDFTNHTITYHSGDMMYLFSDGYAHQFGGPRNKKFSNLNLKQLLMKIANKSVKEQYKLVKKTFFTWKGKNAQLDDVLIMGIRL